MPSPRAKKDRTLFYDLIVVGGGLVGSAAHVALGELFARHGLRAALCDQTGEPARANDPRVLALGYGSVAILREWQLWSKLQPYAYPVHAIVVTLSGRRPKSFVLPARAVGRPAWGWTIPHARMHHVLWQRAKTMAAAHAELHVHAPYHVRDLRLVEDGMVLQGESKPDMQGRLILGAEGRGGVLAATMDSGSSQSLPQPRHPIVAVGVTTQKTQPHHGYWYYDLTEAGGILILIPYQSRTKSTAHLSIYLPAPDQTAKLNAMDDVAYAEFLAHSSRGQILALTTKRKTFTLVAHKASTRLKGPLLFVGDAAYQMIPLGAQGYNLSLWTLEELRRGMARRLSSSDGHPLAERAFLRDFIMQTQTRIDERYAAVEYAAVGLTQSSYLARALLATLARWPDLAKHVINLAAAIDLNA